MDQTADHVIVSPPDRYFSEAYTILLVDVEWGMMEQIVEPLRASPTPLAIHVYLPTDNEPAWLMDVANSADIALLDLNKVTNNDLLKGRLISKTNTWYVGRQDLNELWPRYTEDPLATIMIQLEQHINSRGKR